MPERSKGKSRKRSHLARKFIDLGKFDRNLPSGWNVKQILLGFLICILTTALLVEYEFQSIPDYQVGDIADHAFEVVVVGSRLVR